MEMETARVGEGIAKDEFAFHISEKWAHLYPNVEVAVVTSIEKPPTPPEGYVPLRLGVQRQTDEGEEKENEAKDEELTGFSLDTALWNEALLESRLNDLTSWTRRAPLSLRDKLDRINWLINSK
ncbi:hypothetical protein Poli38472_013895 [Pythium oligandrum]|uniref:Uncharacterized protein n=1 Tax=Pythium oligandrum TaxID=41045 RepID=A0A8K1C2E9_PYTOL|nr:hypothetical protein Poli38472_013895 [Pythium oligandrum]|eukprot:TMW55133.1 hypothetical protein Poli38472_013895 [Pythium oligandrum]